MIIKVKNDLTEGAAKTYLDSAQSAAGTIYVKNSSGFYDNWNVQIGETGEEKAEVVEINGAPDGTSIVLASDFVYDHEADTPVYSLKYNQVVFKRSTAGTAGTAAAMTDGTVTITPDHEFTQFDDTTGSASYAYKACFRSTGLASNSPDSDWLTPTGHDFYSLAKIRGRIKEKLPSANFVSDDEIDNWVNEWVEEMNTAAIEVNEDYGIGTADVSFSGTAQEGTIASSDFVSVRRAWYTENGSDWYAMTKQEYTDFLPSEDFNVTHPYYHMVGDNVIGRNPHSTSGTIRVSFYKLRPVLDSDADPLPVVMRGYTSSFVKWGLAQAYRKDNMVDEATILEAQAKADREKFKKQLTPRNKSGPTYIDIVEDYGATDVDWFW